MRKNIFKETIRNCSRILKSVKTDRKLFLLLLALFLIFILFHSKTGIILFGDIYFYLQKKDSLFELFTIWQNTNFGSSLAFPVSLYTLFFKIIALFIPQNIVSNLYYFGAYFTLATSTAYLVRKLNRNAGTLDQFIIAAFAVTCPLTYRLAVIGAIEQTYSIAFVILAIAYATNLYPSKGLNIKNMFVFFCILLFANAYLQIVILFYLTFVPFVLLFYLNYLLDHIRYFVKSGLLWLGMNFFWLILPLYNKLQGMQINEFIGYDPKVEGIGIVMSITKSNQLFYPFIFDNNLPVIKSLYWGGYYILILQLIFFTLALCINFVLKNNKDNFRQKNIKLYLLGLIVIFYIFSIGVKGRWDYIFMLFWNHVPVFDSYRSIFKFLYPLYISLILLITLALKRIERFKKLKIALFFLTIPSLFVFINKDISLTRSHGYLVPKHYNEIETYFSDKQNSLTKIVPDEAWYTTYKWNKTNFDAVNILPSYVGKDTMYNFATSINANLISKLNDTLNETLIACNSQQFGDLNKGKLLDAFGITHVLVQKDIHLRNPKPDYFCLDKPKKLSYLRLIKTHNNTIDLYSNTSTDILPKIYAAKKVAVSDADPSIFPFLASDKKYQIGSAVLFKSQNTKKNLSDIATETSKDTSVQYKKLSQTHYKAHIKNATGATVIGFNQNYHRGWRLKLNTAELPENKHILINGYANGWSFNLDELCQNQSGCTKGDNGLYDVELSIYYKPQVVFNMGLILSGVIFLSILTIITYRELRFFRTKKS